jgi:hypothetical protein
VALPQGRLIAGYRDTGYVAWATKDPVPDSGRVWADLSELSSQTGLIPILLGGHAGTASRLLDLFKPEDPGEADGMDVGGLLENLWRGSVFSDEDDPEAMEQWAPFTLEWPGLAASGITPLAPAERQLALDSVLPRIEQVFLADECIDGAGDVRDIAARLVNAPIWTFWWD